MALAPRVFDRVRRLVFAALITPLLGAAPPPAAAPELVAAIKALDAGDVAGALPVVQRFAIGGNIAAENELGWLYETGHGVPVDYAEAFKWYRLAALNGSASDQNNLGRLYESGLGVARSDTEAEKWFSLSAIQGFAMGQYDLAYLHDRGLGTVPPVADTIALYKRAADQGLAVAEYRYALCAQNHLLGGPDDDQVALDYLTRAADHGLGAALDALGQRLETAGKGADFVRAFDYYRRAAKAGDLHGMTHLAGLYERGQGTQRNYREAALWYRRAAEQNSAEAAYRLGLITQYGLADHGPSNVEALKWIRQAATTGNLPQAQNHLGIMYDEGLGVPVDPVEAARWYRRAAEQNLPAAMINLAHAYEAGNGIPISPDEALHWRTLAAAKGYTPPTPPLLAPVEPSVTPGGSDLLSSAGFAKPPAQKPAVQSLLCRDLEAEASQCLARADSESPCYEARISAYHRAGCR